MGGSKVKVDHEDACKGKEGRRARKEEGEDGLLLGTREDEHIKGGEGGMRRLIGGERGKAQGSGRGKKEQGKANTN